MPKPLRSADPKPQNVQFSHFGVLDDGKRSKSAAFISIGVNTSILLIIVILGLIVKTNPVAARKLAEIYLPPKPPAPQPPPPPKNPPVMPPKPLPTPPKITTPPPPEKLPEIVKIQPAPAPPKPLPPAPAVKIAAPPAPKIVSLANPKAASVVNNDPHPSAVRLGGPTNPVVTTGSAVSPVNMNLGMHGMPPGNVGSGNPTKVNIGGSGLPGGSNMNPKSGSVAAVKPVPGLGNIAGSVAQPPKIVNPAAAASPPKVLYKPTPNYTAEAKAMHLEGNVLLKIRVAADGSVSVLNVVSGLGHGLDESARQATMATRFKPAVDSGGNPVDWVGTVVVKFQLS
jgi:TonB family protein